MVYATKPLDWALSELYLRSVLYSYLLPLLFLECGCGVCACEVCVCVHAREFEVCFCVCAS